MIKRRFFVLAVFLVLALFFGASQAFATISSVTQNPPSNGILASNMVTVTWVQSSTCDSGEIQYWVNDFTHNHSVTQTVTATLAGTGPYTWTATIPAQTSGDVVEYQLRNYGTCAEEIDNHQDRYYGYGQGPSNIATYHAIHLNRDLNDWRTNEILGVSGVITYYATWDDSYVYVAFDGGITDTTKLNIAVDIDPGTDNLLGASATDPFAGATFAGFLTPEYLVQSIGIGNLDVYSRTGSSWGTATSIYASGANLSRSGRVAEIRIPRSAVGLSTTSNAFGIYLWAADSSDFMFDSFGTDNPTAGGRLRTETVWNSSGSGLNPNSDAKTDHNSSENRTLNISSLRNLYVSNGIGTLSAATTTLSNVTVASGAALQGNSSVTLILDGNWRNDGVFNPATGAVVLSGTTPQSITGTSPTTFYDLILNDGLIAYWKFDEESGTIVHDYSGHGFDGLITDTLGQPVNSAFTTTVPSAIAFDDPHAIALDGVGDNVQTDDIQALMQLGDFTISQWVQLNALSAQGGQDWAATISKGRFGGPNGWVVLWNRDTNTSNHRINLYINNNTSDVVAATIPAPSGGWVLGRWYHYAFTRSGTTLNGYLDGTKQVTETFPTIPGINQAPLRIGQEETNHYYWDGQIDETRIYNRGLSAAEIQTLASGHLPATSIMTLTLGVPITVTHTLRLNSGTFDVSTNNYPITITGDLERNGGGFNARSGTVVFAGVGAQTLRTDAFTFNAVTTGVGVTLTTSAEITVTGALSNSGATRETRAVSGTNAIRLGLANITITPTLQGGLSSLDVIRRDVNHPQASGTPDNGVGWGRYWTLTPNSGANTTFSATLTLPQNNLVQPRACKRLGGSSWDCDDGTHTTNTNSSVTRSGLSSFSDWVVGGQTGFADLTISKTVSLSSAVPSQLITYTLAFSNAGPATATGVMITDIIPSSVVIQSASSQGAIITDTGLVPRYVWQVQNLMSGAGGVITLTGFISSAVTGLPLTVTNTATITSTAVEAVASNNTSSASTTIVKANTTTTVASAPNPSLAGQSVTFTSTVSVNFPGAGIPSGTATFYDSGAVLGTGSLINGIATFTTSALLAGTHPITVTYNGDGRFNSSSGTLPDGQIVIDIPISLSVANSSPTTLGHVTYFTVTATGSNIGYVWNFGDGQVLSSGAVAHISHTYSLSGTYLAVVTATNSISQVVGTTPVTITNLAPQAVVGGNQSVFVGSGVTLDGSGSFDPDGHLPLSYQWTQVGGPSVVLSSATLSRTTFTAPSAPAVLTFTLTVTDARGLAGAPAQLLVAVNDQPISDLLVLNSSPTTLGHVTYFTVTIASGTNVTYQWNLGDGSAVVTGSQPEISYIYPVSGTYTAIITATNSLGTIMTTSPVTIIKDYRVFLPLIQSNATQVTLHAAEFMRRISQR